MNYIRDTFLLAILAGICISIGCVVNLRVGGVAGAVLFALSGKERFVMREITLRPQLHRIRRKSRTAGKDEAQDAGEPVL